MILTRTTSHAATTDRFALTRSSTRYALWIDQATVELATKFDALGLAGIPAYPAVVAAGRIRISRGPSVIFQAASGPGAPRRGRKGPVDYPTAGPPERYRRSRACTIRSQ